MKRKIIGTCKFVIYLYNGKDVRGRNPSKPEHFVYRQWGRIHLVDENGNQIGDSHPFTEYGDMITFINKIMSKKVRKNLR
jgi:hypothetical protein